jgi:hypothetical protein
LRKPLLRLDKPGLAVAALGAFEIRDQSMAAMNCYHDGDQARQPSPSETPLWQARMSAPQLRARQLFPC